MSVEAAGPSQPASGHPSGGGGASQPGSGGTGGSDRRLLRWLLPLVAVIAVVVVAIVILTSGGGEDDDAAARRAPAVAASPDRLGTVAERLGRPVYWAGPQGGVTYELTETRDGRVFVRYLPNGVAVGAPEADYLTVATYPQRDAVATLRATARRQGVAVVETPGGGFAFQDVNRAESAYLAFPGVDVQIEIFDKRPGRALRLASSGQIAGISGPRPADVAPRAATAAELRALPGELGHPVYWAGPEAQGTYELTRTSDGRVYVRYLPEGVGIDADDPDYLTVGTYPQRDASAALRRAAADSGARTFAVANGGVAYVDERYPDSVYVAFPGADVQVEVYEPQGDGARALLRSGRLVPVD
jgi:hypothetical protein